MENTKKRCSFERGGRKIWGKAIKWLNCKMLFKPNRCLSKKKNTKKTKRFYFSSSEASRKVIWTRTNKLLGHKSLEGWEWLWTTNNERLKIKYLEILLANQLMYQGLEAVFCSKEAVDLLHNFFALGRISETPTAAAALPMAKLRSCQKSG